MLSNKLKQAVILAGGLGTRLKPITNDLPKPMVDINGKPFIDYLLNYLSRQKLKDVIILSGYKSEILEDYIGDGSNYNLNITFSKLDSSAQTSERIYNCIDKLDDEFLLMYCDNFIPLNLSDMTKSYFDKGKKAQITVYTNKYLMTKNNLIYEEDKLVKYDKSRTENNLNGVNIGFIILNKSVVELLQNKKQDFESIIFPDLIKNNQISCFLTDHKYYSIGNLDRLPATRKYFKNKKFILLDRDGVLNKKMPKAEYVTNWKKWKWREGSLEALKLLNDNEFEIIIITNQPGVSRGKMTEEDLKNININMIDDISKVGAKIKSIYMCKCNWDDGCDCRKPKPGMIFKAQFDHDFILSDTYFLGDDNRDMEAAKRAGCNHFYIRENDRLDHIIKKILRI